MNRRFTRGMSLALALLMLLALTPARAEGSLLQERMNRAFEAGREVEVVLYLEPGAALTMMIPAETLAPIARLLENANIAARWARDENGLLAMEFELTIAGASALRIAARMLEDGVALTSGVLPDKTVVIPYESLTNLSRFQLPVEIDETSMQALTESLMTYVFVVLSWSSSVENSHTDYEVPIPATGQRDEVSGLTTITTGGAQVKELLTLLAATLSQDEATLALLDQFAGTPSGSTAVSALSIYEAAESLVPTDGVMKLGISQGRGDELVGLDFSMDPLFEGMPGGVYAQYDRLSGGGALSHTFQARAELENEGLAAVLYTSSDSIDEYDIVRSEILLRAMLQPTKYWNMFQLTVSDKRQNALDDTQERFVDILEFTYETLLPSGEADEYSAPQSIGLTTMCFTDELEDDDFKADLSVSLKFMGIELGKIKLAMMSKSYGPADISANEVINLATATEEELAALMAEAQSGFMTALMAAMQWMQPEQMDGVTDAG